MMPTLGLVSLLLFEKIGPPFEKIGIGKRKVFEDQFDGLARIFRLPTLPQAKGNATQY